MEVLTHGAAVPLGGAEPRTPLAALLLENGHVVPTTRLIDVVWPDDPPNSAHATLQTYVKTLRRSLSRQGSEEVIVTRTPGYLALVPDGSLDTARFHDLVTRSRAAATPQEAAGLLDAALALWRGPALVGLEETLLAGEAARLNELRLTATEDRMAAGLALGQHGRLVSDLAALVGSHPANERLRAQYMTALYRLGRQSDALAVFREGRDVLAEELGVDPGPELTELHHAILRGDPRLQGGEPPRVVPAQVPPAPADFTGRHAETEGLVAVLGTGTVQVIAGRGGSGKSALAAHVAHRAAGAFPDGLLHADLRGLGDTPADPGEVLGLFLKALGAEPVPEGPGERAELFRRLAAGRRMLVLLDDAADERQVRPLLPGGASGVLITSRNRLGGLSGVGRTDLDVLEPGEAVELLDRIVGAGRVAAEEPVAREIAELCGRLPLALRIAGARLATRRRWPLRLLADRLADERRRLDELAIADLEVRAGFELSYRALDPAARRALRGLGHLGTPEFAPWVVAWLTGEDGRAAEDTVERLVDAQLVDFARVDGLGTPRYRVHDLVRIYGRERAEAEEPGEELKAAVGRVLGGWLTLARHVASDEIARPSTPGPDVPVSAELVAQVVSAPHDWFDFEQTALVTGLERAAALGLHELVCAFASARLGPSFLGVNRFVSRERITQAALSAARQAGDPHGVATMLAELGRLRYDQDRFAEARQVLDEALAGFRDLGDPRGQAVALATLGVICRETGRLVEALHFLDAARGLLGDDPAALHPLRLAASVRLERGDFPAAWAGLQACLYGHREAGTLRGEALTLRTISLHHRATGDHEQAVETAEAARVIFARLGDPLMEAYSVRARAKAELRLGRLGTALPALEEALAVCQAMGDRWGLAATLRTLGELHLAAGRLDDAEACLTTALQVWDELDVLVWRARTERDLALLHDARGDHDAARLTRDRALKVFRDQGAREFGEMNR
ncbi:AfsR/SARP family transcriptional regulator [Herbidospora sp. RD11066]